MSLGSGFKHGVTQGMLLNYIFWDSILEDSKAIDLKCIFRISSLKTSQVRLEFEDHCSGVASAVLLMFPF